MNPPDSNTTRNLIDAFANEAMANCKYLFFADVARKLGMVDLAQIFQKTAQQEAKHAFSCFRLLHPELVITNAEGLTEEQKKAIAARCLELAIASEAYESNVLYPEFLRQAQADQHASAVAEFEEQAAESRRHTKQFRQACDRFGLPTENPDAQPSSEASDS